MHEQRWLDWIGRTQSTEDRVTAAPLRGLAALLDRDWVPQDGELVWPGTHWLYFLPSSRQSALNIDGHPRLGGFLPPIDLPRRMWAGGRLQFSAGLRVGETIIRNSTITAVTPKEGRSGRMVFVTVRHEIANASGVAVREEQDLVYREAANPGPAVPARPKTGQPLEPDVTWVSRKTIEPTSVLLFRFSALTFNAHRIHYDRDYARNEEGYPDLVVHGPLIATLLLDCVRERHADHSIKGFQFRSTQALFANGRFTIACDAAAEGKVAVRALAPDGATAMEAMALIEE